MEESTTLGKRPTQDKTCHSGRFLGSFHSLGMTYAVGFTSAPIVPTMRSVVPRLIHRLRRSPFPEGKVLRGSIQPHRLYSKRGGRLIAAPTGVVPFNRTGCNCNVAGGRLPPLQTHQWVIPFIYTGYIRDAPGTAHRPFPTYFTERIKMGNVCRPNNCQLSTVN